MKKSITLLSLLLMIINSLSAQQKTVLNANRPAIIKQLALPDLQVSINSITYDKGYYLITYTLKNIGGLRVDLSNVTMQGNILSADGQFMQAGGGSKLLQEGILEPGNEIQSKIGISPAKKLIKNTAYTYQLKADEANSINEQNKNNNIAVAPIIGYTDLMETVNTTIMAPVLTTTAFPDLTVEITNISKEDFHHKVYYKVKNIGNFRLDVNINGLRLMGYTMCDDGRTQCFGTDIKLLQPGAVLAPGQEISSILILEGSKQRSVLKTNQEYTYKLEVDSIKDIKELNENNNIAEAKFKAF